ncbi:Receptor protein [Oopsacas minuta]|uniref:Receptor protein n=1 Tax=Oopsacas minuta TaxID=111878 RepID=A0AAV7KBG4_9METZ|nr:Receptor protein [Oopsacas minuta]
MAEFELIQDNISEIMYLSKGERGKTGAFGYRRDYLNQILSQAEEKSLICPSCKGIVREACKKTGVTECKNCGWYVDLDKVDGVREKVAKLSIKCPLMRECGWKGMLCEGEAHLKQCDSYLLTCRLGCGGIIKRCEFINHTEVICPLREVKCEFCQKKYLAQDLPGHFETCPAHPIKCKCGEEYSREEEAVHIRTECPLGKIQCPYYKYKCDVGIIQRKDLMTHKQDYLVQHQDLVIAYLEKENTELKMQIQNLSSEMRFKKEMDSFEWIVTIKKNEDEFLKGECDVSETEYVGSVITSGSSRFRCMLRVGQVIDVCICKLNNSMAMIAEGDMYITQYQLLIQSEKKDFYTETGVANNSIGRKYKPIFTLVEKIYKPCLRKNNTLYIKVFYN